MKKSFALMTAVVFVLIVAGHTLAREKGPPAPPPGKPFQISYEDGIYKLVTKTELTGGCTRTGGVCRLLWSLNLEAMW